VAVDDESLAFAARSNSSKIGLAPSTWYW